MDAFTDEYLRESTTIHLPRQIQVSLTTAADVPYYVLAEDLDKIGLVHIHEGILHAAKLEEIPENKLRKILLEGFGAIQGGFDPADAWKFESMADQIESMDLPRLFVGGIRLAKEHINKHQTQTGLAHTTSRVLKHVRQAQQEALVISTLADQWERGLIYSALRQLKPTLNP